MLLLSTIGLAHGQAFPNRPIVIIVPFGAGGGSDNIFRPLAEKLTQLLGQQVLVENKTGAGGNIGATAAARAAPDGYTLFNCNIASHGIGPAVYKKLPYDPARDFVPVSMVATVPNVLVVNPSVPARNLPEFIAWAKAGAGRHSYASPGLGTSPDMAMELLKISANFDLTRVPYKGRGLLDVIAGHVPTMFGSLGENIGPIGSGQTRAIAVTSRKRHPALPNVPTIDESGVPGYEVISWNHLCAPTGVPENILDTLNAAVVKAVNSPEIHEKFGRLGYVPEASTRGQMAEFIERERAKWANVAQTAKISLD